MQDVRGSRLPRSLASERRNFLNSFARNLDLHASREYQSVLLYISYFVRPCPTNVICVGNVIWYSRHYCLPFHKSLTDSFSLSLSCSAYSYLVHPVENWTSRISERSSAGLSCNSLTYALQLHEREKKKGTECTRLRRTYGKSAALICILL